MDDENTGNVIGFNLKKPNKNWKRKLHITNKGKCLNNHINVITILENDPVLKNKIVYNEFAIRYEIMGEVPWFRNTTMPTMNDADDAGIRTYMSIEYEITGERMIIDAVNHVANKNTYHPVRDFLNGLIGKWDGVERVDTLLIDFMGANDTELIRMQTRLQFVAAVRRIFEAGCHWKYVLTLKGEQNLGKSSFLQTLAFNPSWFTDSVNEFGTKDAMEQLQGRWIVELAELAGLSKGDQKKVKAYLSSSSDKFRLPFSKRSTDFPRQSVMFGTTNEDKPLKDETGGSRYWIVDVKNKFFKHSDRILKDEVEQIWAEAVKVYLHMTASEMSFALPEHLENETKKNQHENTDLGQWEDEIRYILCDIGSAEIWGSSGKREYFNRTCAKQVWIVALGQTKEKFTSATGRQITEILRGLDEFEYIGKKSVDGYGQVDHVFERKVKKTGL